MKSEQRDVIVIGGGMAGLAAAGTLRSAGISAVVLEARDRVGGRTHTDYSLRASVDLGAAWIHGPHGNPMRALADRYGVRHAATDFVNESGSAVMAFDADGRQLDMADYTTGQTEAEGAFANVWASQLYHPPISSDGSLKTLIEHGLPASRSLSGDEQLGFFYWSVVRSEYNDAADWDQIDWRLGKSYVKLPGGDRLLFGGGYSAIANRLAENVEVVTGSPVRTIRYGHEGVVVDCDGTRWNAQFAIVTVPLGVLKANVIEFEPKLPDEKLRAIERVGFGNYEKLALRFDRFYWPNQIQRFNYLSAGEPSLFHAWLNVGHYTGEPIIVAYHAGRRAREINGWSDEQLVRSARDVMQTIFGRNGFGEIPMPEAYVRTHWQHDPYSLGSYSFNKIGQYENDRELLRRSVGDRLFFAGEATHPHFYATVHGAYESGVSAAVEIASLLGKTTHVASLRSL